VRRFLTLTSAWLLAVVLTIEAVVVIVVQRFGYDSHAYWMAWQGSMYGARPGEPDAYLYSPAFAQVLRPAALLPWPVFAALFALVLLAALVWLLRPLPRMWWLPLGVIGLNEVAAGNVYLLLAVVAVVGFRHPGAWAFAALTKLTPFVGPIWFLVRREWGALATALGVTAAVVAVSYVISPGEWHDWAQFLLTNASMSTGRTGGALFPPMLVRLPLAVALVVWGALTGRRWTVPVAMAVGTPVIAFGSFMVLLSLPRILSDREEATDEGPGRPADRQADPATIADRPAG
jgi:hypothetical protein